jgi:hypothetical protein
MQDTVPFSCPDLVILQSSIAELTLNALAQLFVVIGQLVSFASFCSG